MRSPMGRGKFVLMAEGEKCVEQSRTIGLAAVTFQGGSWTDPDIESGILRLKGSGIAGIAYFPDNDEPGFNKAEKIASACAKWGMPYIQISPESLEITQEKGDIADYISKNLAKDMAPEQIRDALERIFQESAQQHRTLNHQLDRENLTQIHQNSGGWSASDIRERLLYITHQNLSESERKLLINELAQQSKWPVNRLDLIYAEIANELDFLDERQNTKQEIEAILRNTQSSIDLAEVLPENLAKPLKQLAQWMNLRPEAYLMSLLATISSLHKNGTEFLVNKATDYRISPNLFVSIVAESSQKKSPIVKAIASKPLKLLHRDELDRYDQEMLIWKENCKTIQQQDKNAPLPPEPQKRVHYFTRTTGEAILRQGGRQQNGMLYLTDELKALFGSQNAYRKGRGSDEEDLLELYDGTGGKVMRADGLRDDVEKLNLGILGAIQPEVLENLVGQNGDKNGKWARFIFVNQPLTPSTLPIAGEVNLTELLAGIYRSVNSLPEMEYRLTSEAMKRFKQAYDRLEQMRVKEPNQSLRSVIGKTAGRIAKLALNLHVIRWAMGDGGNPISHEIGMDSLMPAIKLANFALQQVKSLYSQFDHDSLAPHLVKVLEFARRRGEWVKARETQNSFPNKQRPTADQMREWFKQLAEMGLGTLQDQGRSLQFSAFVINIDDSEKINNSPTDENQVCSQVDDFLDDFVDAETLTSEANQPFVVNVDDFEKINNSPADENQVCSQVDDFVDAETLTSEANQPFVVNVDDFEKVNNSPTGEDTQQQKKLLVAESTRLVKELQKFCYPSMTDSEYRDRFRNLLTTLYGVPVRSQMTLEQLKELIPYLEHWNRQGAKFKSQRWVLNAAESSRHQ